MDAAEKRLAFAFLILVAYHIDGEALAVLVTGVTLIVNAIVTGIRHN